MFDVVSTADERISLVVTTNPPFKNWTDVLGSERLIGATLDRLTHRSHILEATGESHRLGRTPPKEDRKEINVKLRETKRKIHFYR